MISDMAQPAAAPRRSALHTSRESAFASGITASPFRRHDPAIIRRFWQSSNHHKAVGLVSTVA
jgi:hypothetical protein